MNDEESPGLAQVAELAKRRGFFFPANESYGGVAGLWTYGPVGGALKRNVEQRWRERFVHEEGNMEIQSPTIMPEAVFEASGHLDDFTDWIVDCPTCEASHRADHLVEATGEVEDAEALEALIDDLDVTCPVCGESLAEVAVGEFNLMFQTSIGPGEGDPGYLRPETAQGMFVDLPRLLEYARGQLPFGVAQIGPAYRNEISPRRSIIRVREMTQAELEWFYDPTADEPSLAAVEDVAVTLYPADAQETDGDAQTTTIGEAVEAGTIANPWIAYFIGISTTFYLELGVDPARFRFRQHLSGELAHYAEDCWDAEAYLGGEWVELAGIASRRDNDLRKHHEHSDSAYTVFKAYDEPRTFERAAVDPDMSVIGPRFGDAAAEVVAALEALVDRDPTAFESGETVTVEVDGTSHDIDIETTGYEIEEVTESGEHILPHVAEPAFGIDRLVYTLLEHNFEEDIVDDEVRTYLALSPQVAPTLAGVFPLIDADGLPERAKEVADALAGAGFAITYDDSGAIGRRYRRQDEIGTPYCLTVDHQTLEDDTMTIRDRDTTEQTRIDIDEASSILGDLRRGTVTFEHVVGESKGQTTGEDH